MKLVLPLLLLLACVFGADKKPVPVHEGNKAIALDASLLLDRDDIKQALGLTQPSEDLPPAYVVVQVKVTPKGEDPLRIGPDDFTLLSRKDGDRNPALSPAQIAGGGAVVVVKPAARQPGGDGTRTNGPIWAGISAPSKSNAGPSPLLPVLTEKSLPEKETKDPVEGLLYFAMDGKLKAKDLSLIYSGPAGKLVMDFK